MNSNVKTVLAVSLTVAFALAAPLRDSARATGEEQERAFAELLSQDVAMVLGLLAEANVAGICAVEQTLSACLKSIANAEAQSQGQLLGDGILVSDSDSSSSGNSSSASSNEVTFVSVTSPSSQDYDTTESQGNSSSEEQEYSYMF